jgi:class 3 adenylate cyclase/tetratricopeptide (TPR) repeat protein
MTSLALLEKLAAYVPTPVAHAIYQNPETPQEPTAHRFPGVILFSDISGFTALSELLSKAAPAVEEFSHLVTTGAEELTYLINQYFAEMIQISQAYQGQLVKFSGDALTILFPAEATPMEVAIRRAGECALAMQAKMKDFSTLVTSRGHASLTMAVGIGAGQILACNVGGELERWEYVVAGAPLAQMTRAEQYAQPGQIVFSPEAWQEARPFFAGIEIEGSHGFVQLTKVIDALPKSELPRLDWSKLRPQQQQVAAKILARYIPGAIKARLDEQSDWLAELRRMTIVFVGIGGLDYESPDAGQYLQDFLQLAQTLLYRFGGSLNKVAVDDKGTILLILFGAPPYSHEDNPTRAVAFALELQAIAQAQGLLMSIGITEGTMFAGPVGAPNRREYTVIGDEVNLAARFMQYGRAGAIIISERVRERAGPHFETENLGKISVKGKAHALAAYLVKGELGQQEEFVMRYLLSNEPLIGRKRELEETRRVAARAREGHGQLLFIEGELGLGKSRLTSEILREWIMAGGAGYGGKSISYDRQTSYRVWREVLTAIYGLTPNLLPQQQLARLAIGIADLEEPPGQPDYWANRLPLLADVLGLEAPDNSFSRTISGQLRRNNTFALIEALLHREAQRRPLLVLLEDIHWADELSLSLAAYLAKKLATVPFLLILVHRPLSENDLAPLADIHNLPYAHKVYLDPLSPEQSLDLIENLVDNAQLTDELKDILLSRGQGNPFFLQEIANAILKNSANQINGSINLPETVQDVILSHLDRMAESEKLTLKIASVIGTRFQRFLLSVVHPVSQTEILLSTQLAKLEDENLIQIKAGAPKWEYEFHNVTVQELVYESLLSVQRRQLHRAVGDALEKSAPDEIERLAFHYSRSNNWQKALIYLKAAAEKSRREYANKAAISYYSEILSGLAHPPTGEPGKIISTEYCDILLERVKLYNLIGQREAELEDLGTLGILSEALKDNYRRALVARQWAYQYETTGDYASSLELIERAVHLAETAGAEKLVGEIYNQWGKLLYLRGEYETAHEYLQRALLIAQRQQDKRAQADSLNSLGIVAHYQADYEVALYFFQEATELWRGLSDQVGLGNSLNHIGQVYYDMGQHIAALQCYNESLTIHGASGDRAGEALAQLHLGQVQRSLGNFDTARRLLEEALTTHRSLGDLRYQAHTLYHLGFLHCRLADYDAALKLLGEGLNILREISDPWALGGALTYYGWTLSDMGDLEQAKQYFEEALKLKRDTQQNAAMIEDLAYLGQVALARNDLTLADACARHALSFIEAQGTRGIEHPVKVYLTCYHILQASQKFDQAQAILTHGQQYLTHQIEQINDSMLKQTYLKNIPENRHISELNIG